MIFHGCVIINVLLSSRTDNNKRELNIDLHLVIPRVAIRYLNKGRYDETFAGEDDRPVQMSKLSQIDKRYFEKKNMVDHISFGQNSKFVTNSQISLIGSPKQELS